MDDFISREDTIEKMEEVDWYHQNKNGEMVHGANPAEHQAWYKAEDVYKVLEDMPPAQPSLVKEEDVLKFYYIESLDDYWIGRRLDNFYYATWDRDLQNFVWSKSRYLPWDEHVVASDTLWKEHTYPSEPKEIPFVDWIKGFYTKYFAADVQPVVHGEWVKDEEQSREHIEPIYICSACSNMSAWGDTERSIYKYCPNCGADMRGLE